MTHNQTREQDDHDRAIRNEERLCGIDTKLLAHAQVHKLEGDARQLEASELRRRLGELNNENARILADRENSLPRETHDSAMREITSKLDQITGTLGDALRREVFETFIREQYRSDSRGYELRIKAVEDWKNKAAGAALILTLVAGGIGATIVKALGG